MARLLFEVSIAVAMQCDISHFQFKIYTLFVFVFSAFAHSTISPLCSPAL